MTPSTKANPPIPSSHAASMPFSPRSACCVGEPSRRSLGGALSCAWNSPAPMSRRSAIAAASPSSSAAVTAGSSSTAGCGCANGRSSSVQPSGEAQRSQPRCDDVSATTRRTNATASTALPSPSASRRFGATWLATAPTPTKTGRADTFASARYADPPTGSRATARPTNVASHSTAMPMPIATSAATNAAPRPTAPANTSSCRPVSSSVRIARTAASNPHIAAKMDMKPREAPCRVAADGQEIVRHAVEEAQALVRAEARREADPVGQRWIRLAVADDVGDGDEREQQRERERARARVGERPPREGDASSRQPRPRRRSGGGRSPRATARDS